MTKISLYSPDSSPSLDDLLLTVDIGNGNKNITLQDLADAISPSIATDFASSGGYTALDTPPDVVTNNGNGSLDITFNGVDYTGLVSESMKLKLIRSVSAPTQCADLEASSSQFFLDTTPAGTTFTDDFAGGAWVKLESYGTCLVLSRHNGTSGWACYVNSSGQVRADGYNASLVNFSSVISNQGIALNRWTYITFQLDMSAFTATTTTSYIMINGVDVPATVSRGGTNPTALVQAGNLNIGAGNGANFFDGKICQVWYSSAKVTQSSVRTLMYQGLTSSLISANSIVSGYSLSNSIADLNTTNANDLTASGSAVATNVDSPFGNYLGGTDEFAVVTKSVFSTNTTFTVQIPEGCGIPTSGGLDAVYFSGDSVPYKFPKDQGRWGLETLYLAQFNNGAITAGNYTNVALGKIILPIGAWDVSHKGYIQCTNGASPANMSASQALSESSTTYSGMVATRTASRSPNISSGVTENDGTVYGESPYVATVETPLYLVQKAITANSTIYINGATDNGAVVIRAKFALLV
jgi:hypothetical protein